MAGLATGLVIAVTSFLLGTLAMHWTADHLLLWQSPITHASLISAHAYYSRTLAAMPATSFHVLGGIGSLGALILVGKVFGGRESNWLFDGASLFLFGASGVIYVQKIRPSLLDLPPIAPISPLSADPLNARDPTFLPLRELAASNAVLAAALVGVVLLQSAQYYSARLEERERVEEEDARVIRRVRRREQANRRTTGSGAGAGSAVRGTTTATDTSQETTATARRAA